MRKIISPQSLNRGERREDMDYLLAEVADESYLSEG
jgi:hypothetical protein